MPRYTIAVDLTPEQDAILQKHFAESGRATRVDVQEWGARAIHGAIHALHVKSAKPKSAKPKSATPAGSTSGGA